MSLTINHNMMAMNANMSLSKAYGNLGPGWHVDDTGTPRLVRDDEAAFFEDDDAAVAFVRRVFHALAL